MKRLNITIPDDIDQEIKDISDKSNFISIAIKEKLDRLKKEKLDKLLIEGYKETCREDKDINDEWEEVTIESLK